MDWSPGIELTKDPDAVKDWKWDWSDELSDGDSINTFQVIPETGIVVDATTSDATSVTVWLSGGTSGEVYDVTVRIVAVSGYTDDKTVKFRILPR